MFNFLLWIAAICLALIVIAGTIAVIYTIADEARKSANKNKEDARLPGEDSK